MPLGLGGPDARRSTDASKYYQSGERLRDERMLWHLSHLDIARADGRWSSQDVADLESQDDLPHQTLTRYRLAIRKLTDMEP